MPYYIVVYVKCINQQNVSFYISCNFLQLSIWMCRAVNWIMCSGCNSREERSFLQTFTVSCCKLVKQICRHCTMCCQLVWQGPQLFWLKFYIDFLVPDSQLSEWMQAQVLCDCTSDMASYITLFNIYKLHNSSAAILKHHRTFCENITRQVNNLCNKRSVLFDNVANCQDYSVSFKWQQLCFMGLHFRYM